MGRAGIILRAIVLCATLGATPVVAGFVQENQPLGEVYARLSLSTWARQHERLDEALEQLGLAERAAERHGDPHVLADVRVQRAWEVMKEIGDVSHNFEAAEGTN